MFWRTSPTQKLSFELMAADETRRRRFVRPLHPALRMEVSSKPVMRKERSSNLVMRKEKRREVPVHEVPVHEVPIHEAPSVDRVPVPSGDPQ